MDEPAGQVTQILEAAGAGDAQAAEKLLPLVYDELRRLAGHYLQDERVGHTLQPTALVHDAYLRLVEQRHADWRNRTQFLGIAARIMRRLLVDHARARPTAKRAGTVRMEVASWEPGVAPSLAVEILAVDRALDQLAVLNALGQARQSRKVAR